jgi:hypothetical protein
MEISMRIEASALIVGAWIRGVILFSDRDGHIPRQDAESVQIYSLYLLCIPCELQDPLSPVPASAGTPASGRRATHKRQRSKAPWYGSKLSVKMQELFLRVIVVVLVAAIMMLGNSAIH